MALQHSGLGGPLPLPSLQKFPPPTGWTGAAAPYPSGADVAAWTEDTPAANVALRLADGVVGVDVDAYGDKRGGSTLAAAEAALGALPRTFRSTSRADGASGIYLFRAPVGSVFVSTLGAAGYGQHVEVIQRGHRYAVVAPSIHPEGREYRWVGPDGVALHPHEVPSVDDLAELPPEWVVGLAVDAERADVGHEVLAPLDTWPTAEVTDPYVVKVAEGIATDTPRGDWHAWAFFTTCRLAAAARLGLITRDDLSASHRAVVARLRAARSTRSSSEEPQREAARCWRDAVERTARMTTEQARASLGIRDTPTPASTTATPTQEPDVVGTDPDSTERDALGVIDLTPVLDGSWEAPAATMLPLSTGGGLLYPGETHSMYAEPGSGKSMIANAETARVLACGGLVAYIDFESSPAVLISRLRALGTPEDALRERLTYARPEAPFVRWTTPPGGGAPIPTTSPGYLALLEQSFDLVVLDGVTAALSLFASPSDDGDAYATWHRAVPQRIALRTGAAVLMIDHVTKATDTRGRFAIGSQSKLALISGAAYRIDVESPLGPNRVGRLLIKRAKDRHGAVDALIPADNTTTLPTVAVWSLDARGERLVASVTGTASPAASEVVLAAEGDYADSDAVKAVREHLLRNPDARPSRKDIEDALGFRRATTREAVNYMIRHGGIRVDGPPKARSTTPTLRLIKVGDPMLTTMERS